EIDLGAENEFGSDFGGAAAARLAVLADDLNLIGASAALQPFRKNPAHLFQDEAVRLAKARKRSGLRTDMADLDDAALGIGRNYAQHRRRGERADQHPPRDRRVRAA